MFWNSRMTSWVTTLDAFLKGDPLRLSDPSLVPSSTEVSGLPLVQTLRSQGSSISYPSNNPPNSSLTEIATCADAVSTVRLLNEYFETNPRCTTAVTVEWFVQSILGDKVIWIVSKDRLGTVRGCICSRPSEAPYPNSVNTLWGIVDWFCVHPLWRSKGIGSALLETLDIVTYRILGRKAHIFLKEGLPLSFLHIPVYMTFLYCRRAGNPSTVEIPKASWIYNYMTKEKETGLPLLRVDLREISDSDLDTLLPPCIVFSSIYMSGWKRDSLVSMYAFRWIPGKWLGSRTAGYFN